jgi:hypothetical protein
MVVARAVYRAEYYIPSDLYLVCAYFTRAYGFGRIYSVYFIPRLSRVYSGHLLRAKKNKSPVRSHA